MTQTRIKNKKVARRLRIQFVRRSDRAPRLGWRRARLRAIPGVAFRRCAVEALWQLVGVVQMQRGYNAGGNQRQALMHRAVTALVQI